MALAEILPVAGGTARVRKEDDVAVGGKKLRQMGELGVVGPYRPAVGTQKGRIFLSRDVVERLVEIAGDGGAVFALELDVFGRGEFDLRDECVVDVCDPGELAVRDGEDFAGAVRSRDQRRHFAGLGDGIGV